MQLADVNVLVYAFQEESEHYSLCRRWLDSLVNGNEAFALSELVCSAFVRHVTNQRIYVSPTPIEQALAFINTLRDAPNCVTVRPGEEHWTIFDRLCRIGGIRGNLVPDAYFAALAIESGSEWITMDRDFARFPGLRWRRPF